jgi:hypothetical protein
MYKIHYQLNGNDPIHNQWKRCECTRLSRKATDVSVSRIWIYQKRTVFYHCHTHDHRYVIVFRRLIQRKAQALVGRFTQASAMPSQVLAQPTSTTNDWARCAHKCRHQKLNPGTYQHAFSKLKFIKFSIIALSYLIPSTHCSGLYLIHFTTR